METGARKVQLISPGHFLTFLQKAAETKGTGQPHMPTPTDTVTARDGSGEDEKMVEKMERAEQEV